MPIEFYTACPDCGTEIDAPVDSGAQCPNPKCNKIVKTVEKKRVYKVAKSDLWDRLNHKTGDDKR